MKLAYTKPFNVYNIAYNTSLQSLIVKLSDDNVWQVRWNVAWNTNIPKEILAKLSGDNNSNVRNVAKESLRNIK